MSGPSPEISGLDATHRAGEDRLAPGAMAGEYRVEEHVGSGAMGDVYRAVHPLIGKRVAVKVLGRRLLGSPEAAARFVREAKAQNRVNHPAVVDVFAIGELADGRLWLAMDFLDGESLARRLRRDGPLSPSEMLGVLRPVCEALDAAHAHKVVHRDLKSDNIFLSRPRGVYVLDFGIAKVLADVAAETGGAARPALTAEGSWLGTPAYMAPEQWTADGAGPASDIYSLGVVAYEMLAGRLPFAGPSVPSLMEQHFRAEPPPIERTAVPAALEAAIRRALAKKPEERPATAMAFLAEVERALGIAGRSVPGAPASRRSLWLAGALGAGVALAAGLAVVLLVGGRRQAAPRPEPPRAAPGVECVISLTSRPSGAEVRRAGARLGVTPIILREREGEALDVELGHLGYAAASRHLVAAPDLAVEIGLEPVRGFEGVWQIPGPALRAFERTGEQVAAYELDREGGARRFLRFFHFVPAPDGAVGFSAVEEHADERAPGEPSCHIQIAAEYRFHPENDQLELRRQSVDYTFQDGRCVLSGEPRWLPFAPATRLASGTPAETTLMSQGAGVPEKPKPPSRKLVKPPAPPPPMNQAPQSAK